MDLDLEDPELGIISSLGKAASSSPSYFNYNDDYRHSPYNHDHDTDDVDAYPAGLRTPSLLSSPSVASSLGFSTGRMSPLRRELPRAPSQHDSYHDDEIDFDASPTARRSTGRPTPTKRSRDALARRLSHLAQQLTASTDDLEDDGIDALTTQLEEMERAMIRRKSPPPSSPFPRATESPSTPFPRKPASPSFLHQRSASSFSPLARPTASPYTPSHRASPRGSVSVDLRSRSETLGGGSLFSSPASSIFRTRYSDLSASIFRDKEPEPEPEPEDPASKMGMSVQQANKVIAEAMKLNDELTAVVTNLKARQEETDHIQALLVERAERAAQRIIFLQNRISHLEGELQENDDELQHLRISLKAVEIQMPPHPDRELQRCIATFKQDYQALKRKRANRNSMGTVSSLGMPSPSR
ncbi:Fc.00g032180.m01.CDS01 [Cosmosporella sp. VM-42]